MTAPLFFNGDEAHSTKVIQGIRTQTKKLLATDRIMGRFGQPDETKQAVLLSIRFPLNKLPSCVNDALASCGDRPESDMNRNRMAGGANATDAGEHRQNEGNDSRSLSRPRAIFNTKRIE